jgi:hypothetical protein
LVAPQRAGFAGSKVTLRQRGLAAELSTAPPTSTAETGVEQDLVYALLPLLPKHLHAIKLVHTLQ